MHTINNKHGFTLTELLAGMAIMAIIMAGIFQILQGSLGTFQYSQKRTHEVQQARAAVLALTADLRKAHTVTPAKGGTLTITPGSGIFYYTDGISPLLITHTVQLGSGDTHKILFIDGQAVTANIVKSVSFKRVTPDTSGGIDGRMLTVTVTLLNPENDSSGDYTITTDVFSPNLTR